MLGWALAASADSEGVGMTVTLLLVLPGVAWVFGRFLKRSDGNPIGLLVGAKILTFGVAVTLALLGFVRLVFALIGVATLVSDVGDTNLTLAIYDLFSTQRLGLSITAPPCGTGNL